MAYPLSFSKYCELAVARLYELEQDGGSPRADVAQVMADLDGVVAAAWSREAARHLVDSGLAVDLAGQGSRVVELNERGRHLAEAGAGIIGEYQRSPQVVFIVDDGNQVAVGRGQTVTETIRGGFSKEEVVELLDEAEGALEADTTLTDTERQDALTDLASMRTQLAKATPNWHALSALAAGLPALASLAGTADRIRRLVG